MNQKEKLYFEELNKQCREAWAIFKNPMYRGALEIAQNLYKDKAHFVYELLQNADDQDATMVRFILSRDSLIFVHNVPRHFTITNHETHETDQKEGRFGDINSIVFIAFSAKQGKKRITSALVNLVLVSSRCSNTPQNQKSMMMAYGFP